MISIRTALVAAAFVAMGLTTVAEHLANRPTAEPEASVSVGTEDAMPGKVLRLTQKTPAAPTKPDLSPWI